jgi:hypothetical protein
MEHARLRHCNHRLCAHMKWKQVLDPQAKVDILASSRAWVASAKPHGPLTDSASDAQVRRDTCRIRVCV